MTYLRLPNSKLPGRALSQTPTANGDAGILPLTLDVDIATDSSPGVVQVGSNINVDGNSVISIPQSVASTANITFGNITDSALTQGRITFAGASGLLTDSGNLTFNTGTNTLSVTNVTVTNNANIVNANVSGNLTLNGNSVITSVTPTAGNGISITSLVSSGPAASWTVNNTGVTKIIAGTNITISPGTGVGNVTINAAAEGILQTVGTAVAYTALATDEYIGVTVNPTIVTLPTGVVGKTYIVKNETTGTTTVTGTLGQLLDSTLTKSLGAQASISVVFRAGAWRII